jgi:SAM-dependent methyltransferase
MTADEVLAAQRKLWARGDYPALARHMVPISVETLDLAGVAPGDQVLDVGVGDGNTAAEAARRGATVTGIDLSPDQLDKARARLVAEGLDVDLHEANAEELPFPDGRFDVVVSVLGVIFAPDHARATAEMVRVCRPGGTVAITAWQDTAWFRTWRDRAMPLVTPDPSAAAGPRPDLWGDADEMTRRLGAAGIEATVHERPFHWSFPSCEAAARFFLETASGFIAFKEAATAAGHGDQVLPTLEAALEDVNEATDGTCRAPSPILVAVGRRHPSS